MDRAAKPWRGSMTNRVETSAETIMTSRPSTLLFVHIPKTAGLTFVSILAKMYGDYDHCTVYPNWDEAKERIGEITWNGRLRAMAGHFVYGLHADPEVQPYINDVVRYATFLRDPVRRVVSHFNHVLNSDTPEHQAILAQHPTLEDFLDYPWGREVQTLFLLGWELSDIERAPDAAVQAAIEILRDRIEVFGLTEEFDKSLILFAEAFGWRLPPYTSTNLATERSRVLRVEDLSQSLVARIKDANRCDVALYEFARGLFDERCAMCPAFDEKLSRYRASLASAADSGSQVEG
jgi:Sulfotransferase family